MLFRSGFWTSYLQNGNSVHDFQIELSASNEYFQNRASGSLSTFLSLLREQGLDGGDLSGFLSGLQNGTATRKSVATVAYKSTQAFGKQVENYYQTFLKRLADSGGKQNFTDSLVNGTNPNKVIADIVSSDEYFART